MVQKPYVVTSTYNYPNEAWIVQRRDDLTVHHFTADLQAARDVRDALNDEAARYEPGGDLDDEYWGEIDEEGTW